MKQLIKSILISLIQSIESYESRQTQYLPQDDFTDKIQNTLELEGYEVLTDSGYQSMTSIHLTKPYTIWKIKTNSGRVLEGADTHILFNDTLEQIFIKDLTIGSKVTTIDGIEIITQIQKFDSKVQMFDTTVDHTDHRYYTNGFLSHNTVTASIFNAWYLTFNYDKTTLLLANKSESTKEIIDKAKVVIENLPFFMKPGIIKYDVMNVKADNGCRLIGQSTTAKSGIGFTIHNLYLDEFAHVHPTIVNSFYENVYPTLSASKVSRINITSTPNGFNKFYEIYSDAEKGLNEYKATRIDWWQHPDRDDAWYKRELGNLGSEDAFNRQYGNEFTSSSSLLLSPGTMKNIRKNAKKFVWHDIEDFENSHIDTQGYLSFDPDFDIEEAGNSEKYYMFSVDIAEGNGGDYSVINMFEVEPLPDKDIENYINPGAMYDFFRLNQVGVFRSNEHPIEDFAKILYILALEVFNAENVKLIIEFNTYGSILLQYLSTVFPGRNEFEDEMVLRFKHRHDAKAPKAGIRLKSDNKSVFCQNFKKFIEMNRVKINDVQTVQEASLFGIVKNGSYGAQMGNDDTIMTCITATEFFTTVDYADYVEELLDIIEPEKHSLMEKILYKNNETSGDLQFDIYDILN